MGETCDALAVGKCTLKNNSDEVTVRPLATVPARGPGGPLFSFSPPAARQLHVNITTGPSVPERPSVLDGSFDCPTYNYRGRIQLINWSASEDVIQPPACGVYIGGDPKYKLHRERISPPHLRHGEDLLLVDMVDFRNPAVIEQDESACISWRSSSAWAV
jgi:hypothetical protein